jgi:hypothetical protein
VEFNEAELDGRRVTIPSLTARAIGLAMMFTSFFLSTLNLARQ